MATRSIAAIESLIKTSRIGICVFASRTVFYRPRLQFIVRRHGLALSWSPERGEHVYAVK
jgi:hypothetical protein